MVWRSGLGHGHLRLQRSPQATAPHPRYTDLPRQVGCCDGWWRITELLFSARRLIRFESAVIPRGLCAECLDYLPSPPQTTIQTILDLWSIEVLLDSMPRPDDTTDSAGIAQLISGTISNYDPLYAPVRKGPQNKTHRHIDS